MKLITKKVKEENFPELKVIRFLVEKSHWILGTMNKTKHMKADQLKISESWKKIDDTTVF